jgi:hypothetical protein
MISRARSHDDPSDEKDDGGQDQDRTDPIKEIEAMGKVASALAEVDRHSAQRILRWAAERFGAPLELRPATNAVMAPARTAPASDEDLSEFFARAAPNDGPERALIVGYWLQVVTGQDDLEGLSINSELKNLGHGLPNVTATLSLLMNQQPALVIQTRKIGSSKQGRKRYRLTAAGIARVRQMVSRGPEAS